VLNEIEGFVQTMDEVFIAWWLKQVDDRGCNKRGEAWFEDDASVDYEHIEKRN
jgi:hypothetical protein